MQDIRRQRSVPCRLAIGKRCGQFRNAGVRAPPLGTCSQPPTSDRGREQILQGTSALCEIRSHVWAAWRRAAESRFCWAQRRCARSATTSGPRGGAPATRLARLEHGQLRDRVAHQVVRPRPGGTSSKWGARGGSGGRAKKSAREGGSATTTPRRMRCTCSRPTYC
jgi:hypothetical protein